MLRDEFTENPRWGQNVIDKAKLKIFIPVLALKRVLRFVLLCFRYMSNILFFLQFVLTRWKYRDNIILPCDKKSSKLIEGFLHIRNWSSSLPHPDLLRPESYRSAAM